MDNLRPGDRAGRRYTRGMAATTPRDALEDVVRDLDLVVFRLERPASDDPHRLALERKALRHELEHLKDRLDEIARRL